MRVICPKCQNQMRTVDKGGVHIEQCLGCGGVFLDRGEMEQIARAEAAFYADGAAAAAPPPYNPAGPAPSVPPHQMSPPTKQMPHYGDSPKPYKGGYEDSPKPYRGGYRDSPRSYGHGHHGPHGHRKRKGFLDDLFGF
ncbi:MAG: transcriptional regulator [Actinophytocola sp.]|nr:transcriptional regulator [Actinophytocola sp.]